MWLVYKLYFTLIITQLVKNLPAMQESLHSWVRKIRWRRDRLPNPVFLGFPCGSVGKESICNVGDVGSVPGLGRSPGEGKGNSLQYFRLENLPGQRSLMGYSPWGCKGLDTTEWQSTHTHHISEWLNWKDQSHQLWGCRRTGNSHILPGGNVNGYKHFGQHWWFV